MTKKNYKQKYEELLVEKHKNNYIHIPKPSWNAIGRVIAFLTAVFLSIVNFIGIIKLWDVLEVDSGKIESLMIIPSIIMEYVLIAVTVICLVAIIKGGFDKLKSYKEGIVFGLIVGVISGLIVGVILGVIYGVILGVIYGVIAGVIYGLILGLILGVISGLICEFEGEEQ